MKMKNYFLVLVFFSAPHFFCNAQNNFEVTFGSNFVDAAYSIKQTLDRKYIITGSTQSFTNGDDDLYLALLDTNGALLWSKTFGNSGIEAGYCVRQTSDSGFIVAGISSSFGAGSMDFYLVRTDKNGDTLWTQTYGGTDFDYGFTVEQSIDGGFILAGQESSTNGGIANAWVLKVDPLGDTIWTQKHPLGAWTGSIGIHQRADSSMVIFGDYANNVTGPGDYDLFWMELDSMGDILSTVMMDDTLSHNYATALHPVFNSGYILISENENLNNFNVGSDVILLNANLDTAWTRNFSDQVNLRDVTQTSDSGFICTGSVYDLTSNTNQLIIIKLSKDGDSLWTKYYDGIFSAAGFSIDHTSDNCIVVCGSTIDSLGIQTDFYVIKSVALNPQVPCQSPIITQPSDTTVYENYDGVFVVAATLDATSFRWQNDSTGVFTDLQNGGIFSGVNSDLLYITGATLSMDGYNFRCIVGSSPNCSDTSEVVTLYVNTSIGISPADIPRNRIYPNPVSSILKVAGKTPEKFIVYDVSGKAVAEVKGGHLIDVSFLNKGIYYIQLFYKDKEEDFYKFLKN